MQCLLEIGIKKDIAFMKHNDYPRIVIAGVSSGVGKTTIALAIMAALSRRGVSVQGFKVGPDFIDPGYYNMVTGRHGRNLDTWMTGKDNTAACFMSAARDADISVIEGVMGFYDGKDGLAEGSTAEIAKVIESPVLVAIDCSKMGGSAGAIALGFQKYDAGSNIRGFLLNKVGSDRHEAMVRGAVEKATGLPVIGCIRRNTEVTLPERHLGLVTQFETAPAKSYIDALVDLAEKYIDIDALLEIARSAQPVGAGATQLVHPIKGGNNVRIGIALDRAFNFYYRDNFDIFEALGAEIVFFSPLDDAHLPEKLDGLYVGGGYPELYACELSENRSLAAEIRRAVEDGLPVYAECGGLMYLAKQVKDFEDQIYPMSGALPIECKMERRPFLGYRQVQAGSDSIIARKGDILRGHEFHYSTITGTGDNLQSAYRLPGDLSEGFIYNNTLVSYIHMHFGGRPELPERFLSICRSRR